MENKGNILPQAKPQEIKVLVFHHPSTLLKDQRQRFRGIVFGTIENIAKQYGVKIVPNEKIYLCTAPKNRMQLFVEKLHFARIPFQEL